MKIKRQFIVLSSLIISIPILCSVFVLIHTYIHSPNRYLITGSSLIEQPVFSKFSNNEIKELEKSLKMLPKEVETLILLTSNREIVYSTMPEFSVGERLEKNGIWNYASQTSDKYFYQISRFPPKSSDTILITRLPLHRINTERQTRLYLKILLLIIIITITSLILILFMSKSIFKGLNTIESSSLRLAEGKLDLPITNDNPVTKQNEITSILTSLEKMRCELREMQERKNRFIMGISHDLRTPVAVIKGYSEAIEDDVITAPAEIKNSINLIDQKATQLEGMIDTLINFMKFNNTEIKEKLISHSITKLITDFARYAELTGTLFKRKIKTNISFSEDIFVPLNVQLVQRSFENLFTNAIRYTSDNDLIEINAESKIEKDKKCIILQIKDSGSGIDEKDLDYIFDLFYRGSNSRQEEGMGIGLSVVKNIMNTHGWHISVDSKKGQGTSFTIEIPY